jgi:hypothetical protein
MACAGATSSATPLIATTTVVLVFMNASFVPLPGDLLQCGELE